MSTRLDIVHKGYPIPGSHMSLHREGPSLPMVESHQPSKLFISFLFLSSLLLSPLPEPADRYRREYLNNTNPRQFTSSGDPTLYLSEERTLASHLHNLDPVRRYHTPNTNNPAEIYCPATHTSEVTAHAKLTAGLENERKRTETDFNHRTWERQKTSGPSCSRRYQPPCYP